MDMKKILQAIDGVAVKPVEGINSMAKFLRVVKEAELNQDDKPLTNPKQVGPAIKKANLPNLKPIKAPPLPNGPLESGQKVETKPDGTISYAGGFGEYTYDKTGKPLKYRSPMFNGFSQSNDLVTGNITVRYMAGPLDITANFNKDGKSLDTDKVKYDLGMGVFGIEKDSKGITTRTWDERDDGSEPNTPRPNMSLVKDPAVYNRAMAQVNSPPVQENLNDISHFVSIVKEGQGPLNRLTQAESIAVYHAASSPTRETITNPVLNVAADAKSSMIGKYFKQVEEELAESQSRYKERSRKLAERIIENISPIDPTGKDLGNGFTLTTTEFEGKTVPAVFDSESKKYWIKNEFGRKFGFVGFVTIQNGKATGSNPGPMTAAALKAAGLAAATPEPQKPKPTPDAPEQGMVGDELPKAEKVDGLNTDQMTVTVNGQSLPAYKLGPTDPRPRSGQRIAIPYAMLGSRSIGNAIGIIAGGRVFILPSN